MKDKEQEERRCKHPKHPTYFLNKDGYCKRAWKCEDYGTKECVAKKGGSKKW